MRGRSRTKRCASRAEIRRRATGTAPGPKEPSGWRLEPSPLPARERLRVLSFAGHTVCATADVRLDRQIVGLDLEGGCRILSKLGDESEGRALTASSSTGRQAWTPVTDRRMVASARLGAPRAHLFGTPPMPVPSPLSEGDVAKCPLFQGVPARPDPSRGLPKPDPGGSTIDPCAAATAAPPPTGKSVV